MNLELQIYKTFSNINIHVTQKSYINNSDTNRMHMYRQYFQMKLTLQKNIANISNK